MQALVKLSMIEARSALIPFFFRIAFCFYECVNTFIGSYIGVLEPAVDFCIIKDNHIWNENASEVVCMGLPEQVDKRLFILYHC